MKKFASRKFLVSMAAFLASIGGTIAGFAVQDRNIMIAGIVCTALSSAIYAGVEAYVDAASVSSTTTNITASTTAKEVVEKALTDASAN